MPETQHVSASRRAFILSAAAYADLIANRPETASALALADVTDELRTITAALTTDHIFTTDVFAAAERLATALDLDVTDGG